MAHSDDYRHWTLARDCETMETTALHAVNLTMNSSHLPDVRD